MTSIFYTMKPVLMLYKIYPSSTGAINTTLWCLTASGVGIFWESQVVGGGVEFTLSHEYMNLENCSKLVCFLY